MARQVIGQLIITVPITAETGDDVSSSDSNGGSIYSRGPSHAYDRGWDRIFGRRVGAARRDADTKPN